MRDSAPPRAFWWRVLIPFIVWFAGLLWVLSPNVTGWSRAINRLPLFTKFAANFLENTAFILPPSLIVAWLIGSKTPRLTIVGYCLFFAAFLALRDTFPGGRTHPFQDSPD